MTSTSTSVPANDYPTASENSLSDRFAFGRNWRDFIEKIDAERVAGAIDSLSEMLGMSTLEGKSFLDVGCGSGLFSLAARELGASVISFDFDPDSVTAASKLLAEYRPGDPNWKIHQGSALDEEFLRSLGAFDVVYAWGVLHHTGDLWRACDLVGTRVAPGGVLFISIYNDQGLNSRLWRHVKRTYVRGGPAVKQGLVLGTGALLYGRSAAFDLLSFTNPLSRFSTTRARGMSRWNDLVDWVGGFPFEVAKPDGVFSFYRARGFILDKLSTCAGGHGCNQFVFRREMLKG